MAKRWLQQLLQQGGKGSGISSGTRGTGGKMGCCLGDVHLSLSPLPRPQYPLPLERTEDLLVVEVAASAPGGGSAPHSSWWCPCTTSPVNTTHHKLTNVVSLMV